MERSIDIEKVIKRLENTAGYFRHLQSVGFFGDQPVYREHEQNCNNAIALLKDREAVTIKKTKEHVFGVYGGICPKCNNWIQLAHSFCGFCGQAVKWDDK